MLIFYSSPLAQRLTRTTATILLCSSVLLPVARGAEKDAKALDNAASKASSAVHAVATTPLPAESAAAENPAEPASEEILPASSGPRIPAYLAAGGKDESSPSVAPSGMLPVAPVSVDGRISSTVKPGQPYSPLSSRQKAKLQLLSTFQPSTLARISFTAGLATLRDSPNEWPRTVETYNWRFADRVGQRLVFKSTEFMVGSLLFHEDPRYFLSEKPGTVAKLKNALKQTWMARRDDGNWAPAWGAFAGAYTAGYVSAQWMPESRQSMDSILIRSSSQIGFRFCNNLLKEFTPSLKRKFKH
jgi:hypothetical protein